MSPPGLLPANADIQEAAGTGIVLPKATLVTAALQSPVIQRARLLLLKSHFPIF